MKQYYILYFINHKKEWKIGFWYGDGFGNVNDDFIFNIDHKNKIETVIDGFDVETYYFVIGVEKMKKFILTPEDSMAIKLRWM